MTGRYEALKEALVAALTTLPVGRGEGGVEGGRRSQLLEASHNGPRGAPLLPLRPFS